MRLATKKKAAEAECCEEHVIHAGPIEHARQQMPAEEITSAASDFFKAFSDKTRLRILAALGTEELCVCDIASLLNMSQSAISHQLRFLKQARLVRSRKSGKTVYYALCDSHIQTILAQGIAHVQEG
ncbi:metalloregulator ArsR/SmtB family transcription factor [Butyricicoccus faecihominis]|nr:metalloregulator ArsR/SmtB family transcription factor [Butyricicoccus faecihominis]MCQ5128328.1 metalloregulator ArsR/SmtB family transcription factor [Butyricicoccus faecihominis]